MKFKQLLIYTSALLFTTYTFFTSNTSTAFANTNEVSIVVNGENLDLDVPAQIINGRTMVPMRKIFEELGMVVEWFDETQTVMAAKQGVVVEFPIGSTTVSRNTVEQTIDVPAQLVDSRTLVPVRFVSEFAGAEVVWDGNTKTVFINSTDNIKQLNWNDTYEYWGEVENGEASGYGALYNKKDGSLRQIGKYIDSKIVTGTDFYDNGENFHGNYEDGHWAYGIYCYACGDSYIGEFENGKKHGTGSYYFANGDYHDGQWIEGVFTGYGSYYYSAEQVLYTGNFTNGKKNGYFVIDDLYLGTTTYASYIDGEYIFKPNTLRP